MSIRRETIADVLIIGGGLVGSAVAFGIAERGVRVIMLDEGDSAFRAARGNAGLIWYQGKGRGMRRYQEWSLEATQAWPQFAEKLKDLTGIDVAYRQSGGLTFCINEAEYESRRDLIDKIRREAAPDDYGCRMLDRTTVQELLPGMKLGDTVVGASYSVHDGHVNPLALLRALHAGLIKFGGAYYAGHPVFDIRQRANQFIIRSWAALRVITPDKMPIYQASESSPQVFAIALHSGVTLASLHAGKLVSWIMDGREPAGFQNFHSRRFHV